jgi:subtilisin family serine protease
MFSHSIPFAERVRVVARKALPARKIASGTDAAPSAIREGTPHSKNGTCPQQNAAMYSLWLAAVIGVLLFCGIFQTAFAAPVAAKLAPISRTTAPITDQQGRVEYIVDFSFDSLTDRTVARQASAAEKQKWPQHQEIVINFLNVVESDVGFKRSGMTSWVGTSATAFLTVAQVERLAADPRVKLLSQNHAEQFSTLPPAPWPNTVISTPETTEVRSWGHYVTEGQEAPTGGGRTVFIVDSGVAMHDDLPSSMERVNMACGNSVTNCSTGGTQDIYPVVGCYAHSTHVAGIIGAIAGNGKTSKGIYAGTKMVSVSVLYADKAADIGVCAGSVITSARVGYALDYIYYRTGSSSHPFCCGPVPIVNISINSGSFGFNSSGVPEANRAKLINLATPGTTWRLDEFGNWFSIPYVGAFVVQSAGNIVSAPTTNRAFGPQGRNLCTEFLNDGVSLAYTHAYPNDNTTNPDDGIMVVGAIHNTGEAVDKGASAPFSGYYDFQGLHAGETHSSNIGPCLDAWAPGNLIYSTWGVHFGATSGPTSTVGTTYSGSGNAGTQGWLYLSGTSMSAPHVAGAAAFLADALNLQTPAAIEQAVRAKRMPTGYNDLTGTPIKIVRLP